VLAVAAYHLPLPAFRQDARTTGKPSFDELVEYASGVTTAGQFCSTPIHFCAAGSPCPGDALRANGQYRRAGMVIAVHTFV